MNPAQIAIGMNAARRNAKRLADDAWLLLENNRFGSATGVAILSIEESGKLQILRGLATAASAEEAKTHWREYRSHTKKNAMMIFLELVANGARRLDHFALLFDKSSDHPFIFDQLKQVTLYSDCLGNAHWSEPSEVVDQSLARTVLLTAKILSKGEEVTPREIELWITHVGPYLRGTRELAGQALETWYAEMQREGLAPEGQNAMAQFVNEGVGRQG